MKSLVLLTAIIFAQTEDAPQEKKTQRRLDPSKGRVEFPTKDLVRAVPGRTTAGPVQESSTTPTVDNPPVRPGNVKWHGDFAAACRAAKESGRPVLLFQLLGKLDERFT